MSAKLTQEEFIHKAKETHGNKYDYSKVVYINNHSKIIIICPIHGEFKQTPRNHIQWGCRKCGRQSVSEARREVFTTELFIQKAKELHGDKYDYSKFIYINSTTKSIIICPTHGEFQQTPNNHLHGNNCLKCSNEKTSILRNAGFTTELFIHRAKKVHGDKYDYSKSIYVATQLKLTIICPIHGEFQQRPLGHMHGQGCPKCADQLHSQLTRSTTELFIQKARKIHGNKYDYSKVVYINNCTKVIIMCPIHGEFQQPPHSHLAGHECYQCGNQIVLQVSQSRRSTTEEFIQKARKIYGDKYDYSKLIYINISTKVTIICPIHGEFQLHPNNHLRFHGCPKCSNGVVLQDGTLCRSLIEAYYYLKLKEEGIVFLHDQLYPSTETYNLGKSRYDFYIPSRNEYIEVTGYENTFTAYHKKIKRKKLYVEQQLHAKFTLINIVFRSLPNEELLWLMSKKVVTSKEIHIIKLFNKIHHNKYDYSKVKYFGRHTKVIIICPIHGEFQQDPNDHAHGHGCPKCGIIQRWITRRM